MRGRKTEVYEQLITYIQEHQADFYRIAASYLKNPEDAMDAVQNAACKALEKYRTIRQPEFLKTWFYRILINECKNMLKKFPRREELDMNWIEDPAVHDQNLKIAVDHCLESLKPQYRDIIYLKYFQGFEFKEISRILGVRNGTVKSRYYKGMELLKMQWEGENHV